MLLQNGQKLVTFHELLSVLGSQRATLNNHGGTSLKCLAYNNVIISHDFPQLNFTDFAGCENHAKVFL